MNMDRDELVRAFERATLQVGRSHRWGFTELDGRRIFVKACIDERRLPRLASEWFWLTYSHARAPRLVPEPLGYVEQAPGCHAFLATAVVAGEPAERRAPVEAARALGAALRELHAVPCVVSDIRFDRGRYADWPSFVLESMTEYVEGIREHGGALDASVARELLEVTRLFAARLDVAPLAIVHGDPTFANLIVGDGRATLIDLETAHAGDPLFDLATARLLAVPGDDAAWAALTATYGLHDGPETSYRLWFYQLLRQVRIARGKAWIHRQPAAFAEEMQRVEELLKRRRSAEGGHG